MPSAKITKLKKPKKKAKVIVLLWCFFNFSGRHFADGSGNLQELRPTEFRLEKQPAIECSTIMPLAALHGNFSKSDLALVLLLLASENIQEQKNWQSLLIWKN